MLIGRWKANIANFKDMIRGVSRITISRGTGRGAAPGAGSQRHDHDSQVDPADFDRGLALRKVTAIGR